MVLFFKKERFLPSFLSPGHSPIRIGILGGSFDPAHEGHAHIARTALRRLRLHQVWLMVSPGNPLKPPQGMAPFATRLASARRLAEGRRIVATDIERRLGTTYTIDTMAALRRRYPRVRFVWLMGADNLVQFPHFRGWMSIARTTRFAVMPRPTYNHAALANQAARRLRRWRMPAHAAPALALHTSPAWVFLPMRPDAALIDAFAASIGPPFGRKPIARKPTAPPGAPAKDKRRPTTPPAALASAARAPGTPRKKAAAAGPRGKREAPAPSEALDALQKLIVTSLEDDKAEDVVAVDLAGRASFADRMVIATGLADRQISAMATHLEDKLAKAGLKRIRIEGAGGSDWVLIDAGDIVIHLFKPDARALYGLEKMWGAEFDEAAAQVP